MEKRTSFFDAPLRGRAARRPQGAVEVRLSRGLAAFQAVWVGKIRRRYKLFISRPILKRIPPPGVSPRSDFLILGFLTACLLAFPAAALAQTPTDTPSETQTVTPTDSPTLTPTVTETPQASVNLGSAASFVVLAGTTVTNTGPTTLCGNLGLFPGSSVTGGPVMRCGGVMYIDDSTASTAQTDLTAAYNDAAGRTGAVVLSASSYDILPGTLPPGVYRTGTTLEISGAVTLDGGGDPNAVFIFQVGSGLDVDGGSSLVLVGGATTANVFWQVGSTATINAGANFAGTIMALTDIDFLTGATFSGRALARNGQVTLQAQSGGLNTPTITPTFVPTNTPTITPTPTITFTPTITPTFDASGLGKLVLAPVPAHRGGKVILFFDQPPASSRWEISNVAGEKVAVLSFHGLTNHYWDTTGVAAGLYFVRIQITYLSGKTIQITRKAVVIP